MITISPQQKPASPVQSPPMRHTGNTPQTRISHIALGIENEIIGTGTLVADLLSFPAQKTKAAEDAIKTDFEHLLSLSPWKTLGELKARFGPHIAREIANRALSQLSGTPDSKARSALLYMEALHRVLSAVSLPALPVSPASLLPKTDVPMTATGLSAADLGERKQLKFDEALMIGDRLHVAKQTGDSTVPHTMVRRFIGHARPQVGYQYFVRDDHPERPSVTDSADVCVIIPFFNESHVELKRTLMSLCRQQQDLAKFGGVMRILLVADGWSHTDPSTKQYLKQLFGGAWSDSLDAKPKPEDGPIETVIIHHLRSHEKKNYLEPVRVSTDGWLHLTLLIKRDNRKKHNSHEWFLTAFAEAYNAGFLFLTDCGTSFSRRAFFHLLAALFRHPNWTGVSGRPRLLSAKEQGVEESGLLTAITRSSQAFDYEATSASFTSAFAAAGLLPVLPGPCGMYRYSSIRGPPISFYVNTLANDTNPGLLMGSLLLAEDRILSYAAVLKSDTPDAATSFVPEAAFCFDAETQPERLIAQRRRWINGTVAGYVFVVLNFPLLWTSSMSFVKKCGISLLVLCQLGGFVIVALSPGFLALLLYFSISGVLFPDTADEVNSQIAREIFAYAYLVLYLIFAWSHHFLEAPRKLYRPLYNIVATVNAALATWVLCWLAIEIWRDGLSTTLGLVLCTFALPFVLAGISSIRSVWTMAKNLPGFLLFLGTFTGFFSAYSFSRLHDLSWGNRPSSETSDGGITGFDSIKTDLAARAKLSLLRKSRAVCFLLTVANLVLVSLVIFKLGDSSNTMLYLSGSILGFVVIQLILAFLFVLAHKLRQAWHIASLCCWTHILRRPLRDFYMSTSASQ